MTNLPNKLLMFTVPPIVTLNEAVNVLFRRLSTESSPYTLRKEKKLHPYRKIHPWKSLDSFSKDLIKNILYNKEGLIVLNKPYGISAHRANHSSTDNQKYTSHFLPNAVDYCLQDSLPDIAKELNYESLTILKSPERYMTGATILAANTDVINRVNKSLHEIKHKCPLYRTFWIVTTMIPKQLKGENKVAIKLSTKFNESQKKAVILHTWSKTELKRKVVKPLIVKHKVLSISTLNLSSLIEIQVSTLKWHAIRLFAATVLLSPVLGDNYYGTRIKNIMGTWFPVQPFEQEIDVLPPLNKDLLELLKVTKAKQEIIPAHVHLRSLCLPSYFGKNRDFVIEAPLLPPFTWTCEQLRFKYLMENKEKEVQINVQNDACNNSIELVNASVK